MFLINIFVRIHEMLWQFWIGKKNVFSSVHYSPDSCFS